MRNKFNTEKQCSCLPHNIHLVFRSLLHDVFFVIKIPTYAAMMFNNPSTSLYRQYHSQGILFTFAPFSLLPQFLVSAHIKNRSKKSLDTNQYHGLLYLCVSFHANRPKNVAEASKHSLLPHLTLLSWHPVITDRVYNTIV